jgi:hypothetical protein
LITGSLEPEICEFALNTQRFVIFGARNWIQNCEGNENLLASWQRKHNPAFRRRILEQWPARKDKAYSSKTM